MHLHEILFSRGDVMGNPDLTLAIMDPRNCGWVDVECHPFAEGGEGQIASVMHLIRYEGYVNVKKFLLEMSAKMINASKQLAILEEANLRLWMIRSTRTT